MAEVRFSCPECGKALKCSAKFIGSPVKCPECNARVIVPEPPGTAKPPEDEPAPGQKPAAGETPPEPESEPGEGAEDEGAEQSRGKPEAPEEEPTEGDAEPHDEEDEAIAQYLEDGQPAAAVHKTLERIADLLKEGESVEYIAVQHNPINPLDNIDPGSVVITPRRLIVCRPKLLGRMEFRPYPWYEITNLRLSERIGGATIAFRTAGGENVAIDLIPKKQGHHLYAAAQACHEIAREERRRMNMEQSRARLAAHQAMAAPQIPPQSPPPPPPQPMKGDPFERLKKLKEMLELGLINEQDYESKKQELLGEL